MRFSKLYLIAVIALPLLTSCSLFDRESDVVKMSPLPQVTNQFVTKVLWKDQVGRGTAQFYSQLSPTAQDSTIYAASRNGVVEAINSTTGKVLWQNDLAKARVHSPETSPLLSGGVTVSDNKIFIGSEHAFVYCLDAKTGKLLWSSQVQGEVLAKPVVSDGLVLIHTSNGYLEALNEKDGSQNWSSVLDDPHLTIRAASTPVVAHGAAIVGDNSGHVNAVFLDQGELIWQTLIAQTKGSSDISKINDVDVTPLVVGNTVYAASYNGGMAALNLSTGAILWHRQLSSINNFALDPNDENLYFVDQNDVVSALASETGLQLWQNEQLKYRLLTAPVAYNNHVIVGDAEGYLHWLDSANGKIISQVFVNKSGFLATPLVVNDVLVVQAKDGTIYGLSLKAIK